MIIKTTVLSNNINQIKLSKTKTKIFPSGKLHINHIYIKLSYMKMSIVCRF